MKDNIHLLTIVTVNKNSGEKFHKTRLSLESFISNEKDTCWLIIDNLSEDESGNEINSMFTTENIKIIKEEDLGIYDAMNKGIMQSKSKFILFINSGDSINAKHLKIALEECNKINGSLVCNYKVDENINILRKKIVIPIHFLEQIFSLSLPSSHNSIIYKKEILEKTPFLTQYICAADYQQYLEIKKKRHRFFYRKDLIISNLISQGYIFRRRLKSYNEALKINKNQKNLAGYLYWKFRIFLYKIGVS